MSEFRLLNKDFKAAIITMLQKVRAVEMNGKTEVFKKKKTGVIF